MRALSAAALALFLLAACGEESSPTPVPDAAPQASPIDGNGAEPTPTPQLVAAAIPAPTATPTFAPGPIILPTVALPTPTVVDDLAETLDTIGSRTSALRELYSTKAVDREFIGRDELLQRLRESLDEEVDDLYQVQTVYRALGVLDRDASLRDLMLALLGEQIIGFFDTEEEKLFVVQGSTGFGPYETRTYSHEFVHALQQQHFDIFTIGEELEGNSDKRRAFGALVEGDATIGDFIYVNQHFDDEERAALSETSANASADVFNAAPHLIQRTLLFPYSEGASFVVSLIRQANGWDLVNQGFSDLPQSTEQILRPEKYLSREAPISVQVPELVDVLGEGWAELRRDNLGEFFWRAYLETDVSAEAAALAAGGWGGDRYVVLEGPRNQSVLVSVVVWDSVDEAQEFLGTFVEFTRERTGGVWQALPEAEDGQVMERDDQVIFVRLSGTETLLVFAPDTELLDAIRASLEETS